MHARSYSEGMETPGTVQDDVSAVRDFASQVRALCAQLTANPFNTPAAEKLVARLIDPCLDGMTVGKTWQSQEMAWFDS